MEWDGAYYWPENRKIRVLGAISKREKGRLEAGDCWCHEDCYTSSPKKGTQIFPRNRKSCPHFWRGSGNNEKTGDCEYHNIQKLKNESTRYSQFYHDLRNWLNSPKAKDSLQFSTFYEEKSKKYSDFIIKHNSDKIDWGETEILVRHKNRKRRPRTSNFLIIDLSQWTADQISDFDKFSVKKIIEEFEQLVTRIFSEREDELERVRLQAEQERIREELEEQKERDREERKEKEKKIEDEGKLREENRIAKINTINDICKLDFAEIKDLLDEILIEQQDNYRKKYYDQLRHYHERLSTHGVFGFPKFGGEQKYQLSESYVFPWEIDLELIIRSKQVSYQLNYSESHDAFMDINDFPKTYLIRKLVLSESRKWNEFSRLLVKKYLSIKDKYKLISTNDIVFTHRLVEKYCISYMQDREIEFLGKIEKRSIEELNLAKEGVIYQPAHKNWIEFEKYKKFVIKRFNYYKNWQGVYQKVSSANPDSHSADMFDKSEYIIEFIEKEHKMYSIGGLEFKRHLYNSREVEIDGNKLIESCSPIMLEDLVPGYSMLGIPAREYKSMDDNQKIQLLMKVLSKKTNQSF